ncbi:MAG: hypothetical protein QW445_07630 [Candidatus Bathyarchaeia archaeon]
MMFDVVTAALLFSTSILSTRLYTKWNRQTAALDFVELKLKYILVAIAVLIAALALFSYSPAMLVYYGYLAAFTAALYASSYLLSGRHYVSIALTALFALSFMFAWNILTLNAFALTAGILFSIMLAAVMDNKSLLFFAAALTVFDIIMVLGPMPLMTSAAEKIITLQLPSIVILPTFPVGGGMILGLGDVIFASLLTIKTGEGKGWRKALTCALLIAASFTIFTFISYVLAGFGIRFLPATPPILAGWLLNMLFTRSKS